MSQITTDEQTAACGVQNQVLDEKARARENLKALRILAIRAGEIQPRVDQGDCLRALQRRLAYVEETIRTKRGSEGSLNYARRERTSLRWALERLEPILAAERAEREARRAAERWQGELWAERVPERAEIRLGSGVSSCDCDC